VPLKNLRLIPTEFLIKAVSLPYPGRMSIMGLLRDSKLSPMEIMDLVKMQPDFARSSCCEAMALGWSGYGYFKQECSCLVPEYEATTREDEFPAAVGEEMATALPIIIAGCYEETVYDTGAAANFMSWDKAQELGLAQSLEKEIVRRFVLGNKKIVEGIGTVLAHGFFAKGTGSTENVRCYFNVLKKLAVPILIGEPFLKATETLSKVQRSVNSALPLCNRERTSPGFRNWKIQRMRWYV
jgi:hypothetical protein